MTVDRGTQMKALIERLYPVCRSITGDGVRETLDVLGESIPLRRHEVPSGTKVLDWIVPREWNIRDAWIKDASGRKIVDFADSNLHVMSYSVPVPAQRIARADLDEHLHSLPEHPDRIPYRTSYYAENWGFCLPHALRESMTDAHYEVCIESTLEEGALSYAECVVPGRSEREVLISTHVCHPSLANDNLSGVVVAAALAKTLLEGEPPAFTYRFVFAPGTVGALTWLARNRTQAARIAYGLTLVCLGDAHDLTYKRTFGGRERIDRVMERVLADAGTTFETIEFHPYGYDERQYNSPGFRLPVGSLMRGRHGEFSEYHTSADDLGFVQAEQLEGAYARLLDLVELLEWDGALRSLAPYGEPQLGRRGLYETLGGGPDRADLTIAMLWILQCADGRHDLLAVAERSGLPWKRLRDALALLEEKGVVEREGEVADTLDVGEGG